MKLFLKMKWQNKKKNGIRFESSVKSALGLGRLAYRGGIICPCHQSQDIIVKFGEKQGFVCERTPSKWMLHGGMATWIPMMVSPQPRHPFQPRERNSSSSAAGFSYYNNLWSRLCKTQQIWKLRTPAEPGVPGDPVYYCSQMTYHGRWCLRNFRSPWNMRWMSLTKTSVTDEPRIKSLHLNQRCFLGHATSAPALSLIVQHVTALFMHTCFNMPFSSTFLSSVLCSHGLHGIYKNEGGARRPS